MALDANVLDNIVPKILARALLVLRARCIMPRLVNSDYSTDAARKGATIDVPIPVAVGTIPVAPTQVHTEPGVGESGLDPGLIAIKLDNWRQNKPIHLTDKDMAEIDMNETFLPMQLEEAIKALASYINRDIMQEYLGVYGYQGTAGTTPFGTGVGVSDATGVRKILNKQQCPPSDRRGVLDFDAEAAALDLSAFSDADKIMSAIVKMEGEIGRKFGIDWAADDDVPYHTAGTCDALTITTALAGEVGDVSIAVTGDTENETILVGDIITITNTPDDDEQTYVVMPGKDTVDGYLDETGDNGGYKIPASPFKIADLYIAPGLKQIADADATITLKPSHRVNLVFHRDAFAFATRSLDDANALAKILGGSQILSMQDAKTGLVLRLEISRRNKLTVWEFDILWGTKLVRPELACRLAG